MLTLTIGQEVFNNDTQEFLTQGVATIELEHSLVSLSKWESKYEKPFLDKKTKLTDQEIRDYIEMMILTPDVPPETFSLLTPANLTEIDDYIQSKQTATWFNDRPSASARGEVITAEVIYYWMVSMSIPFECQYWHINRLLTLIKVISAKNSPKKKMGRQELAAKYQEINAKRRAELNSKG